MKSGFNFFFERPDGTGEWMYQEGYIRNGEQMIIGLCNGESIFFEYTGFTNEEIGMLNALQFDEPGLTGTGFYGEYRDLVFLLRLMADRIGGEIDIPHSLALKLEEEDAVRPLTLPPGSVW